MKKLITLLFFAILAINVSAQTFEVDSIKYNITSVNTVEVLKIPEYSGNIVVLSLETSGYSGDIVIPSTVTYNNITYSVTSIGDSAFYYCTSLTSITIPNSVISIGDYAFYNCYGLNLVTIPNSVISIGDYAFSGCSSLTSVTIGTSVTKIGNSTFSGCRGLTSVIIPNSVTSIGNYTFYNCWSLISITIGNSVTSIGDRVFYVCKNLTSINVAIDNPNYASIDGVLYDKNIKILMQCPMVKTSVDIPNSVTSIGNWAFSECRSLTSVDIPNSVISIGAGAFSFCNSLTSVTIGTSVTSIGNSAFYYCWDLISITIGNSVTSIGAGAFGNCGDLTSIIIPNSVTSIGDRAFADCERLTSITIGNSVTSIGDWAFSGSGLTSITIPNSVTSIGDRAFYECWRLASVTIPNSITLIGDYTFSYCNSLTSITIPNSVTSIGDFAFNYCRALTSITCLAIVPPSLGTSVFKDVYKNIPLYVLAESIDAYKAANQWKDFINVFGIIDAGKDKTICKEQPVQLYAKGADSYIWSNGMQGALITVTPTITTKYYVTGTYNDTIPIVDSVTVNVINKQSILANDINLNISESRLLCKNAPFTLEVDSGYIYEWSDESQSKKMASVAVKSTYYYVTATDTSTCNYIVDSVYIKVVSDCSVNGTVFYDINQNQVFDYFEKGLKDIKIKIDSNVYAITDNYGKFISNPYKLSCEVAIELGENSNWELTTSPSSYNLNFNDTGINTNVLFGIRPKKLYEDFQLNIFSDIHRNGRPVNHYVSVKNKGTVEGKTTVEYSFDPNVLTFNSCNNCENLSVNGGLISFDTDTIAINDSRQYILFFTVKVGSTGQKVFTQACINNSYFGQFKTKSMVIRNNCDTLAPKVIASYDPNDKQAYWTGMSTNKKYISNDDKTIRYTIRFQNTGNDTAFDIWLADTLSNIHDYSTLEVLASSHDIVTLLDSNGVLKFFFYSILLPDSNINESLSHGFVAFSIKLQDTIKECSEIKNKAGIFFDFNDPIITNEVVNTFSTLTINSIPDTTINYGATITITADSGENYQYTWSCFQNNMEQSITLKPSETTTYQLTVTNQYGCFETETFVINVNNILQAPDDVTICQGQTAILEATGSATYKWSNDSTTSSITVTPTQTTTYYVTGTTGNCSNIDSVVVHITVLPNVNIANIDNQYICKGANVWLSATGANNYNWSNNNNESSINISPTTTTTYSVTGTLNGCTASASAVIFVNNVDSIYNFASISESLNNDSSITLSALPANDVHYLWNTNDTTQSITVKPTENTTYFVTVIYKTTNCFDTESYIIEITSIEKSSIINYQLSINIFPNPTASNLYIDVKDNEQSVIYYELTNLQGQSLMQGKFVGNTTLPTKELKAGVYFLKLHSEKQLIQTIKFVKQ